MNRKIITKLFASILAVVVLSSCTAYKKIPYLKEAESLEQADLMKVAFIPEFKIMPKDILTITVNSQRPDVAVNFNMPVVPATTKSVTQIDVSSGNTLQNYIVDKEGYIEYPVLGRLYIAGLTRNELEKKIKDAIYPLYLKDEPIVNVRYVNFKVSVLGEVQKPGVYEITEDKLNIFDALALAGDMTVYGKRENVLLLRTNEKGEVSVHRINMQDKNLLLQSDLFYLQQNDQLLIEANKTKGNSSSIGSLESLGLSALSIVISVISIITR